MVTVSVPFLAVGTPVYGRVADLAGPRTALTVGTAVIALGAAVSALSTSWELLLVRRSLQGAGAAAIPVLVTAVLTARTEGAARTVSLARAAGVAGALSALAPLLGGVLEAAGTWQLTLGLATLVLLLGGSLGAAGVGGLQEELGPPGALVAVTALPLLALTLMWTSRPHPPARGTEAHAAAGTRARTTLVPTLVDALVHRSPTHGTHPRSASGT